MTAIDLILDNVPSDKPRITLYIDQDIKDDLTILATNDDRSASNYVIQLIKKDIARAREAGELPPSKKETD